MNHSRVGPCGRGRHVASAVGVDSLGVGASLSIGGVNDRSRTEIPDKRIGRGAVGDVHPHELHASQRLRFLVVPCAPNRGEPGARRTVSRFPAHQAGNAGNQQRSGCQ